MHHEKITAIFDQQASTYDQKWSRLAPINAALHLLTSAVLSELPEKARILCVGAGTGSEILSLAQRFPGWQFTAVEPSTAMLEVLQRRAEAHGIASRCACHAGYLDSLPQGEPFDGATAFLVSQFILEPSSRASFFRGIAERLHPEGILISSDLAGGVVPAAEHSGLLEIWSQVMSDSGTLPTPEEILRMRKAYTTDVAVLPPSEVQAIIEDGGFEAPVLFFQAGMIHAWRSKKASD